VANKVSVYNSPRYAENIFLVSGDDFEGKVNKYQYGIIKSIKSMDLKRIVLLDYTQNTLKIISGNG
jgi:hypothetical protein